MIISLLCFVVYGCSSEMHPRRSAAFEVSIARLAETRGPVWWMGKADFNLDGREDMLVAGHRSIEGAAIFFGDPALNTWKASEKQHGGHKVLGFERDRHGCTVADITGDARPDVFCVSGAERGSGGNDNELWKNLDGYRFEQNLYHGAEERSARGRLANFFNFDGQHPPELVTTVWGDRTDNMPNRSRVWRWVGTRFQSIDTMLGHKQGGRCLKVYDINGNGLDDLLTCGEKQGFSIYMNNGRLDFDEHSPGGAALRNTWWWDVALTPGKAADSSQIAFIVEPIGRQKIHIGTLSDNLRLSAKKYIPCSFKSGRADDDIYCARVVWHDFNADGASDLYVVRRSDRETVSPQGDVDDLIIFGPAYDSYLPVTRSDIGAGTEAISIGDAVVRLTAGEDWTGALDIIRVISRADQ
ncbi:MAG: hypothetical protein ABR612_04210 [Chromatocurvus sp.]